MVTFDKDRDMFIINIKQSDREVTFELDIDTTKDIVEQLEYLLMKLKSSQTPRVYNGIF